MGTQVMSLASSVAEAGDEGSMASAEPWFSCGRTAACDSTSSMVSSRVFSSAAAYSESLK